MLKIHTEKKIIFIACITVSFIWMPYAVFFQPKMAKINTLQKVINQKQSQLVWMQQKQSDYNTLKSSQIQDTEHLSLAEKIEEISVDLNMFENLQSITENSVGDDETVLNITLKRITFNQLLKFLEAADNLPKILSISEMEVASDQYFKQSLNVSLTLKEKIINL